MSNLSGIGSVASAGVGLLGNIIGGISQRKANQMNLKINQMNNEFNERMMREQMAWQEEMWNKQNAYNTPLAMKQRYREAGLNPGLMFSGSGAAGVAGSAGNASVASAAGSAQMQPFKPDVSSLVSGLTSFDQLLFKKGYQDAITRNMELQNKYYGAKAMAEIDNLIAETRNKDAKTSYQKLQNLMLTESFDSQVKQIKQNALLTEQQVANEKARGILLDLETQKQKTYLQYYPQELINNLAIQAAEISEKEANVRVAEAKIKNLAADTAYKWAQENGQKINNDVLEKTSDLLVKATNAANKSEVQYYQDGSYGTPASRRVERERLDNWKSENEAIRGYADYEDLRFYRATNQKKALLGR